jgi:hypothetical protein
MQAAVPQGSVPVQYSIAASDAYLDGVDLKVLEFSVGCRRVDAICGVLCSAMESLR